jgi:hypothetical protein
LIDTPAAVQAEVPTLVAEAQTFLQATHNFNVMKSEAAFTTTTNPTNPTHIIGQIPSNWKEPRGSPYYNLQIGSTRELDWLPNRQFTYRQWDPTDPHSVGPPRNMLLGEPVYDPDTPDYLNADLNIEVYPYPDGLSDWTTAPVGEYRIKIPYWAFLPVLSANTDDNWFTEHATNFLIDFATSRGFELDWDDQRAAIWRTKALGNYDGIQNTTLGGWARVAINLDKSMSFAPGRVLVPRRDVYASRDQWRT